MIKDVNRRTIENSVLNTRRSYPRLRKLKWFKAFELEEEDHLLFMLI